VYVEKEDRLRKSPENNENSVPVFKQYEVKGISGRAVRIS
jgi:hypothetical protein